ncbi:MAG: hypothetical protein ACJATV_001506 [Granulosicoccus sp.]|jgi:hypothetical protein
MTQIYITIGIIASVSALVCYVFVRQTIIERKLERDRLQRALDKRAKELLQAITVFPESFLPKELEVFLYRCVLDTYEHLTRLAPSEKNYVEALQIHTGQLEAFVRKPEGKKIEDLQSNSQISELKQYLNLIGNFLQKSMLRGQITQKQHIYYRLLLKELVIVLTVNGHTVSAKQSIEMQKPKLALHYYDLAKKLLTKETPHGFTKKVQKLNARMQPLLELVEAEDAELKEENKNLHSGGQKPNKEESQWDRPKEDSEWKKKNVYD